MENDIYETTGKWRETIDPFSLKFKKFHIKEILGYPHAGNDVFYVSGLVKEGREITAFLKVERQKTADIEREVLIINKLNFEFLPAIIEYSFDAPKYILTKEAKGERLSYILGDNENMESLKYMEAYGELLAKIHSVEIDKFPVKPRNFTLPHEFFAEKEREVFLKSYNRFHTFSEEAFNYYMVLFGIFFYKISMENQDEDYRKNLIHMINHILV